MCDWSIIYMINDVLSKKELNIKYISKYKNPVLQQSNSIVCYTNPN